MAIQGLRDSSNFATNERPENWREALLRLMPVSAKAAKAPLTALTAAMKTEATNDPVFHWWEKGVQNRRVQLAQNLVARTSGFTETVTVVKDALSFKAGDIFMLENALQTGAVAEILRVHQDPTSDTQITLTRGAAGSTAGALTYNANGVNPMLVCTGNAFEEGSLAPTGVSWGPIDQYNYTQIFRATFELTRTAMKTKLRTNPKAYDEAKRETLEVLGMDMERTFFFGRRAVGMRNGKPLRYTGGIYHQLAAANKLATTANTLKMSQWDVWMQAFFRDGSDQKIAFGGNGALAAIQTAVRKNTSYQIHYNEKEYGMQVTKFISPFGELVFRSHPLFNQMSGGTTGAADYYSMSNAMFVLDMENIRYRPLDGSDIHFEDELEEPGLDGIKEGFIGEVGLEVDHASTHFFAYNMVAGAAD